MQPRLQIPSSPHWDHNLFSCDRLWLRLDPLYALGLRTSLAHDSWKNIRLEFGPDPFQNSPAHSPSKYWMYCVALVRYFINCTEVALLPHTASEAVKPQFSGFIAAWFALLEGFPFYISNTWYTYCIFHIYIYIYIYYIYNKYDV